jgi:membrane associated rhomboid family serine protease
VRALRKLILGETWALPLGVLLTLAIGLVLDALEGDDAWWQHAGGFVLLALVVIALTAALPRRR